jgi:hypothetical protein
MVLAVVAAVLLGFLMYGISYLLIPKKSNQVPSPIPPTSMIDSVFGALLWVGLAALLAFTVVAVGILITRVINKRLNKKLLQLTKESTL